MRSYGFLVGGLMLVAAAYEIASCSVAEPPPATLPDLTPTVTPITTHAQLKDSMRQLWTTQTSWSRFYMISSLAGLSDAAPAMTRILQNADDFGSAMRPFYGDEAAAKFSSLLHENADAEALVFGMARANDDAGFKAATSAWHANADELASYFLTETPGASPDAINLALHTYLDNTIAEVTERGNGQWTGDAQAHDTTEAEGLALADAWTDGVTAQFPLLVSTSAEPPLAVGATHVEMRRLWSERTTWTRTYVVDALANLPDTQAATDRLLQNQVDIGTALRPYLGAKRSDRLVGLLENDVTLATEVVESARIGDARHLKEAHDAWDLNAAALGAALADANVSGAGDLPVWILAEHANTEGQSVDRINIDWAGDISQYEAAAAVDQKIADAVSGGLAAGTPNVGGR